MDFITGLPKSKGKSVIMVVVDILTKYAHFFALYHPFKESSVAIEFIETIQKLHGNQKIILEFHTSPLGGHLGFLKTYQRVKKEFSWDGLKSDIQKFVAECLVFQ